MDASKQRAILFDLNMCAGCGKCVAACMTKQGFPGDPDEVKDLSATAYTALGTVADPEDEDETWNYRDMCRHCVVPSCVSVCPVGAFQKTELGPVTYDADKCMGCRYCMTACPFNVPRYEWDSPVPTVRKCDMCYDRQKEGKEPACAETCSYGATISGTREEMLAEARERLEDDPDSYHQHIFGEEEIGGTSVLVIGPPEAGKAIADALGYKPGLGTEPMPSHTWAVLSKVPAIAVFAGATMTALWWLTGRRDEVRAHEAREKAEKSHPQTGGNSHLNN